MVTTSTGNLVAGNILIISNFNASSNQQGTGTTIVQITPTGTTTLFAHISDSACTGGVGLTTALAIVQKKFVVVGSLPTTDGTSATAAAGCLIMLDDTGAVVETFTSKQINGPWDMTAVDESTTKSLLFVTNVLNGTVAAGGTVVNEGTVLRLTLDFSKTPPKFTGHTTIGDGFPKRTDLAALVIGPTLVWGWVAMAPSTSRIRWRAGLPRFLTR